MVLRGCQEGKETPKLAEIRCPKCGNSMEVFVKMGGAIGETGTLVSDEVCEKCGCRIEEGRPLSDFA